MRPISDEGAPTAVDRSTPADHSVIVRSIESRDAVALYEFFCRLSARARSDFHPHGFDAATSARVAAGEQVAGPVWVAVPVLAEEQGIVGYAFLGQWDSDWPVLGVAVDSSWQRERVGRALCSTALEAARDKGSLGVQLTVYTDNLAAVRLYETLGFRATRKLLFMEADFADGTFWDGHC